MNLRGHLDDATMRKLSVMATPARPAQRAASKAERTAVELSAAEKQQLAQAKSRIERRERRKAKKATSPEAKKQPKLASKAAAEARKRASKPAPLTAEARKLNGLSVSPGGPSRVRKPTREPLLDAMPSSAPSRAVREPVPQPTFTLTHHRPFRPEPTDKVRYGAVRSQLKLKEKQAAELIAELSVKVRRGRSGVYILGSDFERLRRHVERQREEIPVVEELSFEQKLLRSRGSSQWQAEGTPLERYESKKVKNIKEAPRTSGPFIQVVSGGLPTLGKGRK